MAYERGTRLEGKYNYQIKERIADSLFGFVYLATDIDSNTDVAIKVLDINRAGNSDILQEFSDTVRLFSSFSHPGIVKVLDFFETNSESTIVMEFCAGGSLSSFLASNQTSTHKRILSILEQVADALDYIHEQSYAYRDFGADNVFFSSNTNKNRVKLLIDILVPDRKNFGQTILDNRIAFAELAYQMLVGKSYQGNQQENRLLAKPSEVNRLLPLAVDEILLKGVRQTIRDDFSCQELVSELTNAHPFSDDGNYLIPSSQRVEGSGNRPTTQAQKISPPDPGLEEPNGEVEDQKVFVSDQVVTLQPEEKTPLAQIIETNRRLASVTDHPTGPDKLNFKKYADAFADLITNPDVNTPLTIGIFGEWGSGKSFLMGKIKEEVLSQQKKIKKPEIDIHIIDFNAWVYSGSEHLWAGLVTHLYRDIEKHFGVKAHWMRLGKAIEKSLPKALGAFAFYGILGLGFSFLLGYNEIQESTNAFNLAVNALAASLLGGSALASLPALWAALREFFDSLFLSRANKLQTLAARPDFSSQIGVMADIKNEIKFIRELLKAGKNGKPTRMVLFIDDLDRCEHRKAVEVLQAIMLLLADEDGSPFVIFLGIDARVVVRAIEEHYGEVLVKAGINGYEYLDKIIQVPFVIPEAGPDDIENYVDSLLWASDEEKETVTKKMTPPILAEESEKPGEEKSPIQQGQVAGPDLPTKAAMYDVQKEQPKPANTPAPEEISVTFTQAEREALKACVADLTGNPRKIKRIINIYRLARLILPAGIERAKAVRWILLTEQWPYHMAWIIEHIENDAQSGNKLGKKSLRDVYQLARKDIHTEALETLLSIDADPGLFEQFIQKEPFFSVEEIKTLLPLTFNLNPAIRSEVCKHAIRLAEVTPQPKRKTVRAKSGNGVKEMAPEISEAQQPAQP